MVVGLTLIPSVGLLAPFPSPSSLQDPQQRCVPPSLQVIKEEKCRSTKKEPGLLIEYDGVGVGVDGVDGVDGVGGVGRWARVVV